MSKVITVEGGEGEEVENIEDIAQERFNQAVQSTNVEESDPREYQ